VLCYADLTGAVVRSMGPDLTGHLALAMGPELTSSIVQNAGIKNIGKLVGQVRPCKLVGKQECTLVLPDIGCWCTKFASWLSAGQ
jgi:hypothetical protein